MADLAALEAQLAEAQAAYHARLTGRKATTVRDATGKMVIYADTPAAQIATYISALREQIAVAQGAPARPARQPLFIRF